MRRKSSLVYIVCAYCNRVIMRATVRQILQRANIRPFDVPLTDIHTLCLAVERVLRKSGVSRCPNCGRKLKLEALVDKVTITIGDGIGL